MGDLAEFRGLIVVVCFLASLSFLITLIPPGFRATGAGIRDYNIPEYFDVNEIISYNFTDAEAFNIELGGPPLYDFYHQFDLGGWRFAFKAWHTLYDGFVLEFERYDYWWIFSWKAEDAHWIGTNGITYSAFSTWQPGPKAIYLKMVELDRAFADTGNSRFTLEFYYGTTKVSLWLGWNQTEYSKPSHALLNSDMSCLVGIAIDQLNTSFNAFNIVGMLLWFEFPDVHWALNWLVRIGLWCAVAYVSAIFVLYLIQAIKPLG